MKVRCKHLEIQFYNNRIKCEALESWLAHSCRSLSQFLWHETARSILLPLDTMLVHCRSLLCNLLGFSNNLPVPIYTPGWREALWELSVFPKNTTQCPQPGLEPRPLAPESRALTMRPTRLPTSTLEIEFYNNRADLKKIQQMVAKKSNIVAENWPLLKHCDCERYSLNCHKHTKYKSESLHVTHV